MSRVVWESVNWRCGNDLYRLEIESGGLFASLSTSDGKSLTLPMIVWEGLLDALKANRATRSRGDQQFPSRSRARWYDGEIAEVSEAYRAGRTIAQIAHAHSRSTCAVEYQLDRLGLISKAEIYGPGRSLGPQNGNAEHEGPTTSGQSDAGKSA